MLGLVDQTTRNQIIEVARESGNYHIYEFEHYFSIELKGS